MKALVRKTDKRIMHINGSIYGVMLRDDCWQVPIPDQDVSGLYSHDDEADLDVIREAYYPNDIQVYNRPLADLMEDSITGEGISREIHPSCGTEEQIGILRAQIGEILNALGLAPTADFDRLNNIATEKIQEGQKKKEAL